MDKITVEFVKACNKEWFELGFDYDIIGMTKYVLESAGVGVYTDAQFDLVERMV